MERCMLSSRFVICHFFVETFLRLVYCVNKGIQDVVGWEGRQPVTQSVYLDNASKGTGRPW